MSVTNYLSLVENRSNEKSLGELEFERLFLGKEAKRKSGVQRPLITAIQTDQASEEFLFSCCYSYIYLCARHINEGEMSISCGERYFPVRCGQLWKEIAYVHSNEKWRGWTCRDIYSNFLSLRNNVLMTMTIVSAWFGEEPISGGNRFDFSGLKHSTPTLSGYRNLPLSREGNSDYSFQKLADMIADKTGEKYAIGC